MFLVISRKIVRCRCRPPPTRVRLDLIHNNITGMLMYCLRQTRLDGLLLSLYYYYECAVRLD